jgi:uncharacterized membrane protein YsdA (DUF1294 family)
MSARVTAAGVLAAALLAWNAFVWGMYRIDKARARRPGARRISERVLLGLAALAGTPGALIAIYAHRQRHKAQKLAFMLPIWLIVVAHAALVAWAIASYARSATIAP